MKQQTVFSTYVQSKSSSEVIEHYNCNNHAISFICPICYNHTGRVNINYDYSIDINSFDEDIDANVIMDDIIPNITPTLNGRIGIYCDFCSAKTMRYAVDYEIADIITELNQRGLWTEFSCCGHTAEEPAYIAFKADYDKCVKRLGYNFKYWYWDLDRENINNGNIKAILRTKRDMTLESYYDRLYLKELKDIIKRGK